MGSATHAKHQYNIHEAKTHLSRILEEVEAGEEVMLSRAGTPVAKVVPIGRQTERPGRGSLKGKIWVADDFDDEDEEINRLFGTQ